MVQRSTLREQIRDIILKRIASGELIPGERINESRLAQELEVSPIPIREAIRELAATGVLESTTHKGAHVRQVSPEETVEALQVRSALEPLAVRLGARELLRRAAELRRHADATVETATAGQLTAYQRHNQAFHRIIAEAPGNSVLLRVWDSLTYEVGARSVLTMLPGVDALEVARGHVSVAEAIERGDIEEAARRIEAHALEMIALLERQAAPAAGEAQKAAPEARPSRTRRPRSAAVK